MKKLFAFLPIVLFFLILINGCWSDAEENESDAIAQTDSLLVSSWTTVDHLEKDTNDVVSYEYDDQANLIRMVHRWQNKTESVYNMGGGGSLNRLSQKTVGPLVNNMRSTRSFDGHGNILRSLDEEWKNNAWINSTQETATYDSLDRKLSLIHEVWKNGAWVNDYRDAYSYDSLGNQLSFFKEVWKNAWLPSVRLGWTYDRQGNILSKSTEVWDDNILVKSIEEKFAYISQRLTGK